MKGYQLRQSLADFSVQRLSCCDDKLKTETLTLVDQFKPDGSFLCLWFHQVCPGLSRHDVMNDPAWVTLARIFKFKGFFLFFFKSERARRCLIFRVCASTSITNLKGSWESVENVMLPVTLISMAGLVVGDDLGRHIHRGVYTPLQSSHLHPDCH